MATTILAAEPILLGHFPIVHGGNSYDLSTAFYVHHSYGALPLRFIIKIDTEEVEIHIMMSKQEDATGHRTNWFIEGVIHVVLRDGDALLDGERINDAKVWIGYDSSKRKGAMKIFAREQPKPLIEALTCSEMIGYIKSNRIGSEFDIRYRIAGTLMRSNIRSVEWGNDRFEVEFSRAMAKTSVGWTDTNFLPLQVMATEVPVQPLHYADGRITFEVLRGDPLDCVVYPAGMVGLPK
ncbi:MAG: hypothetical protein K0S38_718 [Candidatus Paceibacter sp.]|jgi:hypothetical protein|nr:hypothetical protein [Candidatus Paceibacter sp.]